MFLVVRKGQAFPEIVTPPRLAASFLTRSGAATHRSEASHPPPVSFLFWRGSGSGCTLFLSPHGIVAVIGDGNAGRAPANPRTDGAAHARASPFHTNRTFRETTYGGSRTSAQGSPRHSAGHRARSPCSQSPPSRDSFSHDRVAGLRRATSAKRSSIEMAIYRLLKNCTLEPKEVSRIIEAYEQALHTRGFPPWPGPMTMTLTRIPAGSATNFASATA